MPRSSRDDWEDDCYDAICFDGTECFAPPADDTDGFECPACQDGDACSEWFGDVYALGCGNNCGGWYCSYELSAPALVDGQCCYDLTAWDKRGDCSTTG